MVVLLILLALVSRLFYIRNKSNRALNEKQAIINTSNTQLKKALEEKEWLLKEVHHRVKNNLQIVISLLESQADFASAENLQAIRNSKYRIYAMSLIHQKLYVSDEIKTIDLAQYFAELVDYLKDSYAVSNSIVFTMQTQKTEVEVATAVPIGLIFNEIITNALKYAFIGRQNGTITIKLENMPEAYFKLLIEDDGVGLPEAAAQPGQRTLGMKLIHGLSRQLEADLQIITKTGTRFEITCPHKPLAS